MRPVYVAKACSAVQRSEYSWVIGDVSSLMMAMLRAGRADRLDQKCDADRRSAAVVLISVASSELSRVRTWSR
jgi:hypothetical protein